MGAEDNEDAATMPEVLEGELATKGETQMLTGPMTARRSNAKNAYNLMSDIAAYILEEPKRIYMGDWIIRGHEDIEYLLEKKGPVCGTVGCIAGNAVLLTDHDLTEGISAQALRILGGGNYPLKSALEYDLFLNTEINASYGTKKYARIVAGRIAEFQKEHEAELRAIQISKP